MNKSKHIQEIIFLILFAIGWLYFIALFSHLQLEPLVSGDIDIKVATNYLGPVGSYIANFSFSVFGFSAYILPISFLWLGILIYKDIFSGINNWIFMGKFLLFLLFIVAISGFFNNVFSDFAGGWIGFKANQLLSILFGFGVNIIYLTTIMIVFSVLSGTSWFKAFVIIYYFIKNLSLKIWYFLLLFMAKTNNIIIKIKIKKNTNKDKKSKNKSKKNLQVINLTAMDSETIKLKSKVKDTSIVAEKKIETTNIKTNILPTIDLLDDEPKNQPKYSESELQYMAEQLVEKLGDFGIVVEVAAITPGPVITSFEISLPAGVKASRVVGLDKDLARALLVESVRVIDVIPGKPVIGLEIPNAKRQMISLSEIIASNVYKDSLAPLTMCLGKGVIGNHIIMDLTKTPHLLVAGATGMGKSVGLNAMLMGILYKSNPKDVRLIMIDPKVVELAIYADIPHLLTPVVTDMNEAASILFWCVGEMERRYALLAKLSVRNISGFNEKIQVAKKSGKPILDPSFDSASAADGVSASELEELPLIVIIIDEYADMLGALAQEDRAKSKRTESFIIRLAQKARAAGMHLIIATQRPSVDVITGLIKSNVPSRIAFKVSSKIDSRTILDKGGADQLLGMGDMLYMMPGKSHLVRVHGAFVSDGEIARVVENLKANYPTNYIDNIINPMDNTSEVDSDNSVINGEQDPLYDEAVAIVTSSGKASISSIQRKLRIGYNRAARIVEDMEVAGIVSPMNSSGNRQIIAPRPI